jgi:hypothetical protein
MRWLIVLVLCGWSGIALANKPVVAVFEIQNKGELSKEEVEQLTDFVAAQLTASGKYRVVPNSELQSALRNKKAESYEGCYDEACQIEIGKEIAAEKTLATKVSKLGDSCIVTMQLYDLREGASAKGATKRGSCGINSILRLIEAASQDLTGVRSNKTLSSASKSSKSKSAVEPLEQQKNARELVTATPQENWTKQVRSEPEIVHSSYEDFEISAPLLVSGLGAAAALVGVIVGELAVADYQAGATGADTYSSGVTADVLIWTGGLTTIGGLVWYFID